MEKMQVGPEQKGGTHACSTNLPGDYVGGDRHLVPVTEKTGL